MAARSRFTSRGIHYTPVTGDSLDTQHHKLHLDFSAEPIITVDPLYKQGIFVVIDSLIPLA